jgi:hypothetical protein
MRMKSLSLALVAAVLAAPTAQAHYAPAEHATASLPRASTWTASGREIDRLGPKYAALQHSISAPAPATVVKVVEPAGFNWDDAAIDGGVAVAIVAAVTVFLTRRSRPTVLPERSEPAGV